MENELKVFLQELAKADDLLSDIIANLQRKEIRLVVNNVSLVRSESRVGL